LKAAIIRGPFHGQNMNTSPLKNNSCGLDFGTSNSSIGFMAHDEPRLTEFGEKVYIPSAIFFDHDRKDPFFGNEAIQRYIDGSEGRMIWSPKNALGTNLILEKTQIRGGRISFKDIIGLLAKHLKARCEAQAGCEVDSVVAGRPVFFNDDDKDLDKIAQDSMLEVLHGVGFKHVEFEYEPIAAAIHYERIIQSEEIALIVDMGGGTSDFTIAKLAPHKVGTTIDRKQSILSVGGIHVAGTDFDRRLSLHSVMPELGMGSRYKSMEGPWLAVPPSIYLELATWLKIGFVYTNANMEYVKSKIFTADNPQKFERLFQVLRYRYGHLLARRVEQSKVALSDSENTRLTMNELAPAIDVEISRKAFEASIADQVLKITSTVSKTISDAAVSPHTVSAVFMTGGSSLIPAVRQSIMSLVPNAQIVEGDKFGSVAMGLTLAAQEKFA
jgi:hypothetical chaperone protein